MSRMRQSMGSKLGSAVLLRKTALACRNAFGHGAPFSTAVKMRASQWADAGDSDRNSEGRHPSMPAA
eukprot:2543211-Alexandrium_andersonii.AAC.1